MTDHVTITCDIPQPGRPWLYLAAPYSHDNPVVQQWRFERVTKIAGDIMASEKYLVFSPITHGHPIQCGRQDIPTDWEYWQQHCLGILGICSVLRVVKLDGWWQSVGVCNEVNAALDAGIPVEHYYPEDKMVDTCEQVLAETTRNGFIRHLEYASEQVATWPEWNQTVLGARARDKWNAQADEWNQWPALGADEKQELIEAEKEND